ncbi:MAG: mannose-1-phosphate guanylyltransferase [Bacteriovoracaceae bacterium]
MTSNDFYCLVMAGGKGTRLWPESTSKKPKQYMPLHGNKSLIESTFDRFNNLTVKENRYIVTTDEQADIAYELCHPYLTSRGSLVLEPSGRNTAPCILLSLVTLLKGGAKPSDIVAIVPSDHVILNVKAYEQTISYARDLASKEQKIVTIGIVPTFPHTGFGYIHRGTQVEKSHDLSSFHVQAFKEKPAFETAKSYIASGEYYWNAGMFVAPIGVLLGELESLSPEIFAHAAPLKAVLYDKTELAEAYNQIPENSIDYAVMEKSKKILVVPALFDWNDLGSWDALESVMNPIKGNSLLNERSKNGECYLEGSSGNIVYAPKQFVALVGIQDLIVVSNDRALLIMPKKDAQKVKDVYQFIKENKLTDLI